MRPIFNRKTIISALLLIFFLMLPAVRALAGTAEPDRSRFLTAVEDEPDTVDFQCTSIHYTVAQNVFNRLVETVNDADGQREKANRALEKMRRIAAEEFGEESAMSLAVGRLSRRLRQAGT